MKTYIVEGIATALSSISHNGGERNGITTQLRREKIVQPNGKVVEVPVISGNSIRGKLRDLAAIDILTNKEGVKIETSADNFNLLFSGGSLESVGSKDLDIEKVRKLTKEIPSISLFGCSIGNVMIPGRVDIGKMRPICKETLHIIPEKFHNEIESKTVWDLTQVEMYTRKDDTKDEHKRSFIKKEDVKDDLKGGQMMYKVETIAAGTKFYWKVCLRDTNDIETGVFLQLIESWLNQSSQIGGNGRIGDGLLKLEIKSTGVVDSDVDFNNSDFVKYKELADKKETNIPELLNGNVATDLFGVKKK